MKNYVCSSGRGPVRHDERSIVYRVMPGLHSWPHGLARYNLTCLGGPCRAVSSGPFGQLYVPSMRGTFAVLLAEMIFHLTPAWLPPNLWYIKVLATLTIFESRLKFNHRSKFSSDELFEAQTTH